ncbi:MAG TPA: alpha/beta hydrolase [Cyanophyceae cyanobacterium]
MDRTSESNQQEYLIPVTAGSVVLEGNLALPVDAQGIVIFVHSRGSSRHNPQNHYLARVLRSAKLATLLIDLLTPQEQAIDRHTTHLRFDIGRLTERLLNVTDWLQQNPTTQNLKIGYLASDTGSAAAVMAAVEQPNWVGAIASCSGRPDLAGSALSRLQIPLLLIAGSYDSPGISFNQRSLVHVHSEKHLEIVLGASHLFEEPNALEEVARLASQWFQQHLNVTNLSRL